MLYTHNTSAKRKLNVPCISHRMRKATLASSLLSRLRLYVILLVLWSYLSICKYANK